MAFLTPYLLLEGKTLSSLIAQRTKVNVQIDSFRCKMSCYEKLYSHIIIITIIVVLLMLLTDHILTIFIKKNMEWRGIIYCHKFSVVCYHFFIQNPNKWIISETALNFNRKTIFIQIFNIKFGISLSKNIFYHRNIYNYFSSINKNKIDKSLLKEQWTKLN